MSLKKPELKKRVSEKVEIETLRAELKEMNKVVQERQDELFNLNHRCRQ